MASGTPPSPAANVVQPLYLKTASLNPKSPAFFIVNPNDDEAERRRNREQRAEASRRLLENPAMDSQAHGKTQASHGMSKERVMALYQNCIKLAAENKINQKNTWDLQLIDHMAEIVRSDQGDDTQTNFQKASCTLEAGVKIYSYRVDSVHSETFKVLGGLSRTSDSEPCNGDSETKDDGREPASRKSQFSSTLAESFESLNMKKIDRCFAVDPLFHKISAQFDEGGPRSMLMYNLPLSGDCQLVFDSSSILVGNNFFASKDTISAGSPLDLSDLPGMHCVLIFVHPLGGCFHPDVGRWRVPYLPADVMAFPVDNLAPLVSPSTEELYRLAEDKRWLRSVEAEKRMQPADAEMGWNDDGAASEPPSWEDEGIGCGSADSGAGSPWLGGTGDDEGNMTGLGLEAGWSAGGEDDVGAGKAGGWGAEEDWEEMGEQGLPSMVDWMAASAGMLPQKGNAWAGANHWQFGGRKGVAQAKQQLKEKAQQAKARRQNRRALPPMNFEQPPEEILRVLELAKHPAEISLVRTSCRPVNTLLPSDFKVEFDLLFRLSLRPDWDIRKGWGAGAGSGARADTGWEEDSEAGAYDGHADGVPDDGDFVAMMGDEYGSSVAQSAAVENVDLLEEDLVPIPRKVERIDITYAKQSKQVDVKVLKEAIWTRLKQEGHKEEEDVAFEPEGVVSFDRVISSLPGDCRAGSMSDISVHLCFICLLHLANEHNLKVTAPSHDALMVSLAEAQMD